MEINFTVVHFGELRELAQRAKIMGNDDFESRAIEQLYERAMRGEISVEDALAQARAIIDAKQDR